LPGVSREPLGDLVLCDVVREGASGLIERLRSLGIDRDGSIMVERVDAASLT
jgi:hypothetical protein